MRTRSRPRRAPSKRRSSDAYQEKHITKHRKSNRRERQVTLYLTEAEYARLLALAEADGDSPGSYGRRMLMRGLLAAPTAQAVQATASSPSTAASPPPAPPRAHLGQGGWAVQPARGGGSSDPMYSEV